MCTRLILLIALALVCTNMSAQTPVQEVIFKYAGTQGTQNFIAQGFKLDLAKKLMLSTPIAPIASDVDELAILKMQGAASNIKVRFVHDLDDALKSYESYGTHPSKNGLVDVYILRGGANRVVELVIYNPAIYSLNSVHGDFTLSQLLQLEK